MNFGDQFTSRGNPRTDFAHGVDFRFPLSRGIDEFLRKLEKQYAQNDKIKPEGWQRVISPNRREGDPRIGYILPVQMLDEELSRIAVSFNKLDLNLRQALYACYNGGECKNSKDINVVYSNELSYSDVEFFLNAKGLIEKNKSGGYTVSVKLALLLAQNNFDPRELHLTNDVFSKKFSEENHQRLGNEVISFDDVEKEFIELVNDINKDYVEKKAIWTALDFMKQAHAGQTRKNGEPYAVHPLEAAILLIKSGFYDVSLVISALLHDVGEDTDLFSQKRPGDPEWKKDLGDKIQGLFGNYLTDKDIVKITDNVWRLTKPVIDQNGKELTNEEINNIHYGLIKERMSTVILKGVDRFHNNETIDVKPKESIQRYIYETRETILPLLEKRRDRLSARAQKLYHILHSSNLMVMRLYREKAEETGTPFSH